MVLKALMTCKVTDMLARTEKKRKVEDAGEGITAK